MTRDKDKDGNILVWDTDDNTILHIDGYIWDSNLYTNILLCVTPKEFKRIFPKQKLPRKGSIQWVELRLYIPGKG